MQPWKVQRLFETTGISNGHTKNIDFYLNVYTLKSCLHVLVLGVISFNKIYHSKYYDRTQTVLMMCHYLEHWLVQREHSWCGGQSPLHSSPMMDTPIDSTANTHVNESVKDITIWLPWWLEHWLMDDKWFYIHRLNCKYTCTCTIITLCFGHYVFLTILIFNFH